MRTNNGRKVTDRELGRLFELCQDQGGIVEDTGSGHYKIIPPDKTKRIVYSSATPGDFQIGE